MGFSKNEYSEPQRVSKYMVLLKNFENFIFWSKALKIGRFIEESLFFHMVPSKFV